MTTMHTSMVLCVMAFSIVCIAEQQTTKTTPPAGSGQTTAKPFDIGCDTYGNVTLSNLSAGTNSWFEYTCTEGSKKYSANNSIPANGSITLNHCDKDKPITLTIFNSKRPTIVIASQNETTGYNITCREQNGIRKNVIVNVNWTESSKHFPEKAANVSYTLSMSLRNIGNSSAVTTVVLGNDYDLVISGMGDYFVKPTTCVASMSLSYDKDSTVSILDTTTSQGSSVNVLEAFSMIQDSHDVHATLHGFRLLYSDKVYIKCEVDVCAHKNGCVLTTGSSENGGGDGPGSNNINGGRKRKRRRAAEKTLFKDSVQVYFTTSMEGSVASDSKGLMFSSSCIMMAVLVNLINKP